MKTEEPQTYREKYAAEAGAVIQIPHDALPGWDELLDEGEQLLWQGRSQAKPAVSKYRSWVVIGGAFCFLIGTGMVLSYPQVSGVEMVFGAMLLAFGLYLMIPRRFLSRGQRQSFYSLSNRRAFRGETIRSGHYRLVSWPITAETSFRLIPGDPPSIRFYEGRLESGRRPRYHEVFEAVSDAPKVLKLLQSIQKDAA